LQKKIIFVVPCYNEEDRLDLPTFVEALKLNQNLSWLFVDDGSTDQTAQLINSQVSMFPDRIILHQLKKNSGKGEAVRQGLLKTIELKADVTGYFDADLATPMSEIHRLLALFEIQKRKILLGSRVFLLGRNIQRQRWRFWLGRCFALIASQMLKLKVYDTQCGAKIIENYPRLKSCLDKPFESVWLFDVELIQRLRNSGALTDQDFFEEPLLQWTEVGGSKVKAKAFVVALFDLIKIKLKS